jgi:hypothetical protein
MDPDNTSYIDLLLEEADHAADARNNGLLDRDELAGMIQRLSCLIRHMRPNVAADLRRPVQLIRAEPHSYQ